MTPRAWGLLACLVTVLLLAMCGCSPVGTEEHTVHPPLSLRPEPELAAATLEAAKAWTESTGIEIAVDGGSVKVEASASLDRCGQTRALRRLGGELYRVDSIVLRANVGDDCGSWARTLRHEIAHALTQHYSRSKSPGDVHTEDGTGLMGENSNSTDTIDESALLIVCSFAPCAWMQEE